MLRIGIDVGGTNTDAVVLDGSQIVASTKVTTTRDVTSGILEALTAVISEVDTGDIASVIVGSTHFINAIAQATELDKVAMVRLATPPQSLRPMTDWPDALRQKIDGGIYVCAGGTQFDGSDLNELDEVGLREIARTIAVSGVNRVAISGVFSTINPEHELRAGQILGEILPDASIVLSSQVGHAGILERENATILNAALLGLAERVIDGLERVVAGAGIEAPILLSQNDGTVMTLSRARDFPIFTIASGPTNSMRGAALLTGLHNAVVVDVGGTTSDIGVLQQRFPRESTVAMSLAGVRSNFRMPDVLSLAIGGGTIISDDGSQVGPLSVGHCLTQEGRVFGGPTLTFTDVAVAAGLRGVGDSARVSCLPPETIQAALADISERLQQSIELAKLTNDHTPVVAVGGGASLLTLVPGLEDIVVPADAGVANAVGAAIAEVGGEIDRVVSTEGSSRAAEIARCVDEAAAAAVAAGANPATIRIIESEDVPLTHMPGGNYIRIRIKAVGAFLQHDRIEEGRAYVDR